MEWANHTDDGDPIGDACERCWGPYRAEYQRDGSWVEVCSRCAEDPVYDHGYEMAIKILSKEAVPAFDPSEVTQEQDYVLTTSRSFIGIPRSTVNETMGPSHGLTELDCPDESGGSSRASWRSTRPGPSSSTP